MQRDTAIDFAVIEISVPNRAWQSRVAFSNIASNTGSSSPGDELMTRNTSAVAACCSSASSRSRRSRTLLVTLVLGEPRGRLIAGVLRRLATFRPRDPADLPPDLPRFIAAPDTGIVAGQTRRVKG